MLQCSTLGKVTEPREVASLHCSSGKVPLPFESEVQCSPLFPNPKLAVTDPTRTLASPDPRHRLTLELAVCALLEIVLVSLLLRVACL